MAIITFETEEQVPEDLKEGAQKKEDGKYVVDVGLQSKIKEFRDNNIKHKQEKEKLEGELTTFKGLLSEEQDLDGFKDELTQLKEVKRRVDDGEIKESEAIEKEVSSRIDNIKKKHEEELTSARKEVKAAKQETATASQMFKDLKLESMVSAAVGAPDSKMNVSALGDILQRAKEVYVVQDDGKTIPKKDGVTLYGSDGETPLPISEWLENLLEEAPHLGKLSSGGGASGSGKTNNSGGISKESLAKMSPAEKIAYARKNNLK